MKKTAIISTCGTYRYKLTRTWNPALPRVTFIMLNPSTADADIDDPTIRRCINFAKSWGYGGITVVNLFAFRATRPDVMFTAIREQGLDAVGPENNKHIEDAIRGADKVILAWGANGHALDRAHEVSEMIGTAHCLETSGHGHPKHPLYIKAATTPKLLRYDGAGRRFIIPDEEHNRPLPCSLTGTPTGMHVTVDKI